MHINAVTSLLLLNSVSVLATTPLCQRTCQSALSYIKFSGNGTKPQCTNELNLISYFACLGRYCPSQMQDGYSTLQETCNGVSGLPELEKLTISPDTLDMFALNDIRKKTSHAGVLSPSLYALSERTITSALEADELNVVYGNAIYGFWGIILVIALIGRIHSLTNTRNSDTMLLSWMKRVMKATKQHLLIPKLFHNRNMRINDWCGFPTRLESLVVLGYIALNVILHIVNHDVFEGNLKISAQVARSLGHRTGTIVMANLPIMWTFAMRNNVIAWFSGWNFSTFNVYHRWIARVIMAELIAHAVSYTLVMYDSGGSKKYKAQWTEEYWIWGVVAVFVGLTMCISAIYPLRRRFYDAFLLVHILSAVVFLIGAWFHLKKSDKNFILYFWPCVAIWAFDRAMRYGRLIALNRSLGQAVVIWHILLYLHRWWPQLLGKSPFHLGFMDSE
ncbi:hypothetical protein LEMA_P072950.1 [Plenodomus lingam JN3]|uniref:Ferric oxidoreductase domain-containing protein n=1 Tax=Leptosphaeria maculans (strain JN3 / isolate v23.1.3 / race Av1-4-5-6-7-8) TaxID=985895 RepID=E5A7W1_LEPMJ|nr:hypothetical protein LEMA_P072950.1 [Plenodomus lingam JN3]CBX99706.1 hypothetical protein LEMA_P072950.1 [Plenodomus lingam JN3]